MLRVNAICTVNAETHPELGRLFFEHGPEQTVGVVADYLEVQDEKQRLSVANPRQAAWQFLCMIKAESQLRAQYNLKRQPEAELEAYIQSCIDMFLRAYAARN